jgi:hypothetical protein
VFESLTHANTFSAPEGVFPCFPLLGFIHWVLTPPPLNFSDYSLPRRLNISSSSCCHTTRMVRPRVFSTPRRFTPVTTLQVYFTLITVLGFVTFPTDCIAASDACLHLSRNAVYTPRRIPLISCRTTSLWPLPSCCYFALYIQPDAKATVCHYESHRPNGMIRQRVVPGP